MRTATQSLARRIGGGKEKEKESKKQKELVRRWHGYLSENPDGVAQAKDSKKKNGLRNRETMTIIPFHEACSLLKERAFLVKCHKTSAVVSHR